MDALTPQVIIALITIALAGLSAWYAVKYATKSNAKDIDALKKDVANLQKEGKSFIKCFYALRGDIRELIGELRGKGVISHNNSNKGDE